MTSPCNAKSVLSERHRTYLASRAVPEHVAIAAGLRTVTPEEGAELLDRASVPSAALFIPYCNAHGYHRLRLDEGETRFLAPAAVPVPIYLPPHTPMTPSRLIVVEGPIKALAVSSSGEAAIGLGGTGTTLTPGIRTLNESWKALDLRGMDVRIVFDAGRATNPNVARDEARLVIALEHAGAVVRVTALPAAESGADQGPDDYLAARGADALRAVIDAAVPADPAARVRETSAKMLNPYALLDDLPFMLSVLERGVACRAEVRTLLSKAGVRAREFDSALKSAGERKAASNKRASEDHELEERTSYEDSSGRLTCKMVSSGKTTTFALGNFTARIERDVVSFDGVVRTRFFEISGKTCDGVELPRIRVPASEVATARWPITQWGSNVSLEVRPRILEHLEAALVALSTAEKVNVASHLGFTSDTPPVFIHAGGTIGGGDLAVDVGAPLEQYALPDRAEDAADAVRASLRLRDVVGPTLGLTLLSVVYRAPLQHFLYFDSVVWMFGRTGSFKTTIAALLVGHFGRFPESRLPGAWTSTATALEHQLFGAKDVLFPIDDFVTKTSDPNEAVRKTVERIVRSVGNGAGRSRMRSDLTAVPNRPPRGLALSTAESLPIGESTIARLLPIRIKASQVDVGALTEMQRAVGRLPHAMRGYIEFIQQHASVLSSVLAARFTELRAELGSIGGHLRYPAALAHVVLGAEVFAEYAVSVGVFTEEEADRFAASARAEVTAAVEASAPDVGERDHATTFLTTLRELLLRGVVRIEDSSTRFKGTLPLQNQIGWYEGATAFLLPEATYGAVAKESARLPSELTVGATTIWRALHEAGVLAAIDGARFAVKVTNPRGGGRIRVLKVHRASLDGSTEPEGRPTCPTPANEVGQLGHARNPRIRLGNQKKCPTAPLNLEIEVSRKGPTRHHVSGAEVYGRGGIPAEMVGQWGSPPATNAVCDDVLIDRIDSASAVEITKGADGQIYVGTEHKVIELRRPVAPGVAEALGRATWVTADANRDLAEIIEAIGRAPETVIDARVLARLLDGGREDRQRRVSQELESDRHKGPRETATLLPSIVRNLETAIEREGLADAARLESEVLPITARMRLVGLPIDAAEWSKLVSRETKRRDELAALVVDQLGVRNPRSEPEIMNALLERGIPVVRTNGEALAGFVDLPFVRTLLDFRRTDAFVTAHGVPIQSALRESRDGRVRVPIDSLGTVTGRFTTSGINLLGLPKTADVRRCIKAPTGRAFVVADYAALELRVIAAQVNESALLEVFQRGGDPHRTTAARVLGKVEDHVTPEERRRAKSLNFGLAYGLSATSLVPKALADYGVSFTVEEATDLYERFFEAYPAIAGWHRTTRADAPRLLRSASGRLRYFDGDADHCRRLNFPVQATGADGVKKALILAARALKSLDAEILLVVHDEFLVEAPVATAEEVRTTLVEAMREGMSSYVRGVEIAVEAHLQSTWWKVRM